MKLTKRLLALLLVFIFVVGPAAGCDQVKETVYTQLPFLRPAVTQDPNHLVIYTVLSEAQLKAYLPIYQQEHPGVTLEIERASTWDLVKKVLAEKGQPKVDLVWGLAATSVVRLQAENMLEDYIPDADGLKRLNLVNPRMRDKATPPQWVGHDVWMAALCVNQAKMDELGLPVPTSWRDLTDPIYKGQLVMSNPKSSGTAFMTISAWIQQMGEENAWSYMDALHQNILLYTDSGRKPCTMAADGKVPIGISFGSAANDERKRGIALDAIYPQEGSGWEIETLALIKKDVVKPEAVKFMTWALGDSAMQAYAHFYPLTSIKTDVALPPGFILDPPGNLAPNRVIWASSNYDRIVNEWLIRFENKAETGSFDLPVAPK
jgi:iron(III) transport system substrate-binding protein